MTCVSVQDLTLASATSDSQAPWHETVPMTTADSCLTSCQACANDFWAVLRDYAAPPQAALLAQQVKIRPCPVPVTDNWSSYDVIPRYRCVSAGLC